MKKLIFPFIMVLTLAGCAQEGVIEVTAENFDAVVMQATKPVVVDFNATWCGPCKTTKPFFEELAQEHTDWVFVAVDIDQAPEIAAACAVTAVPTFVVFKQGVQWGSLQGGRTKEQLLQELQHIASQPVPEEKTVVAQEVNQLMTAVAKKDIAEVKQLIQAGVDVNAAIKTPLGDMTPLIVAAPSTQEIIDILLQAGAQINDDFERVVTTQRAMYESVAEKLRQTFAYALELAQTHKQVKQTVTLTGDDVTQQMCAALGDEEALKALIAAGADVNSIIRLGIVEMTPLAIALFTHNRAVIDLLMCAGASLDAEVLDETGSRKTITTMVTEMLEVYQQAINASRTNLAYILNHR